MLTRDTKLRNNLFHPHMLLACGKVHCYRNPKLIGYSIMSSEISCILLDLRTKDEGVAIIKINRPEVLNALNRETMSELSTAIDIVDADDKIKVLIITGTGERSFCAGAEIRY
jgi:enoyl-CoA hydratase/isomerase-like protein